jgi:hypothetical protein
MGVTNAERKTEPAMFSAIIVVSVIAFFAVKLVSQSRFEQEVRDQEEARMNERTKARMNRKVVR